MIWWIIGGCFVVVAYAYAGYPVILWLWSKIRSKEELHSAHARERLPTVTVVVAAHNEEHNIAGRIENLLASDYPPDKLDIVVCCDGCSDRTAAIAARYPRVQVVEITPRRGKAVALNVGVSRASGEVIVFADARQRFPSDAVIQLVRALQKPGVGAVGGELVLLDSEGVPHAMGAYWRYEKLVRSLEALVDSSVQCSGAIYAIWRENFVPMPEELVLDDMWVPLHIRRRGQRVVYEPNALAYDMVSPSYGREFRRKVRTLSGNYQLMWAAPWLLLPWQNPLWWQFVSHKLLRLLVPYALIAIYGASWAVVAQPSGAALVVAQTAYYLLGAASWLMPALARRFRLAGLAGTFLSLNAAAAVAPLVFVLRKGRVRWERSSMLSPQTTDDGQKVRTY